MYSSVTHGCAGGTNRTWRIRAFVGFFGKAEADEGDLCIEMPYKLPVTGFAQLHYNGTTADGLEMLLQQAFGRSGLWKFMRATCVKTAIGKRSNKVRGVSTGNACILSVLSYKTGHRHDVV